MSRFDAGVLLGIVAIAAARADERAGPEAVSFAAGGALELRGQLYRPAGPGPSPAAVLLHDCDGVPGSLAPMEPVALALRDAGYAVLIVDSFGPRGVKDLCDDTLLVKSPDPGQRAGDAASASRFLSARKDVDPRRIGLVGWGHGGTAALMAWARKPDAAAPFAAVAAYSPACGLMGLDIRASDTPLLIFAGERDEVAPAARCQSLVENAKAIRPRDLSITVYPGATHRFDGPPGGKETVTSGRHTFTLDPAAAAGSRQELRTFLNRTLRR